MLPRMVAALPEQRDATERPDAESPGHERAQPCDGESGHADAGRPDDAAATRPGGDEDRALDLQLGGSRGERWGVDGAHVSETPQGGKGWRVAPITLAGS